LTRASCPAIGGFLLLWFRPGGTFIIQACIYAIILITFFQLRFPLSKSEVIKNSAFQNIREGVRYAVNQPLTRTFILMGFILSLLTIPVVTILPPIYAKNVFHGGAGLYGILTASVGVGGVGGVCGGVVTALLSRLERWGLVLLSAIFMLGLSLIAFAFSTTIWVAISLLVLAGFFEAIFINTNQILLQLSIPDKLRGRVTSVININVALSILGGLLAGAGSDLLGGPKTITIILAGTASGLAAIIFLASSAIRNYRLSQGIASNSSKTQI
jgi:MFS family permease